VWVMGADHNFFNSIWTRVSEWIRRLGFIRRQAERPGMWPLAPTTTRLTPISNLGRQCLYRRL